MLSVFSCCCPTAFGRSKSIRLNELDLEGSSAAIGMEPVDEDGRDKSPSSTRGSPPMARRRVSTHTRRRAAVTSETTEQLASVRWRSAFDAVRRSESKSPEALAQIIGVLRSHELFASVDESLQTEVAQAMHERLAREGEAVISQGDAGDKFYVVAKGTLAAYVGSPDGSSFVCVGRMGPGDSFGELALLYDAPRAATVRCTGGSALLYSLDRMAFRNLVSSAMLAAKVGLERRLTAVPVLAGVSTEQLSQLASAMEVLEFSAGEYIVEKGAHADALYLILSGEVACHHGGESELRLAEGAFFGESCLQHSTGSGGREGGGEEVSGSSREVKAALRLRQANVVAVSSVRCAVLHASHCVAILGSLHSVLDRTYSEKVLASITLFDPLSASEKAMLINSLQVRSLPSGHELIRQGSPADAFHVLRSGALQVLHEPPDGGPSSVVSTYRAGDASAYFGERSLLKRVDAVATVVAIEDSEVLSLPRHDFESIFGPLQAMLDRGIEDRDAVLRERASQASLSSPVAADVPWTQLEQKAVLGVGSFGCVRLVLERSTGRTYALKGMHKGHLIATSQVDNCVREKRLLQRCAHPFIMACHGAYHSKSHVYLLLGLAQGGELFTYLQKKRRLDESTTAMYVAQVASAFGFLGARKIAHRDLKLENLLFDEHGYLKLVDFGFAKVIEDRSWTFCGTPDYLAPEIVSNLGHNRAVDWWTLGILTYELLHGEPPFAADEQMETYRNIRAHRMHPMRSSTSGPARDLIRRLLSPSPSMRLGMLRGGANDVRRHDFCAHIEPAQLDARTLPAPYIPRLKSAKDTSNFDSYPADAEASAARKYERHLDSKYDAVWDKEFGATV